MTKLPDNWVSGYDGQRWYFQYEPTGMVQYHFPQEGDEYAEFLLDVGTGPIKLTPEDSLAIEQETKRRSAPGSDDKTKGDSRTSGSKREKQTITGIEEEYDMSATGYFDSSAYFPDAYNTISPLGEDDPRDTTSSKRTSKATGNMASGISPGATPPISNLAVELPESNQQMWSPVGFVAELATQETVKCAEELAPVELDATSYTPPPIQTNITQQSAELPTHRTPVENKTLVLKPTQPTQLVMQPVDSYPLVHASFTYPPLKSDMKPANSVSQEAISTGEESSDAGGKFQPWKPTQGVMQQSQSKTPGALPPTSVLQNQDSELGSFGKKNAQNPESSILGDVPHTLAPPLEPRKSPFVETSLTTNPETSSIPAVLQLAHRPEDESSSLGTAVTSGKQARHDSISVPVASQPLSYAPSVIKPSDGQPDVDPQESEGNHTAGSIFPHCPPGQATQASSSPSDLPSVMRVNALPNHLPSTNPKVNGSPGFLFFHEIPSNAVSPNHGTTIHQEDSSKPILTSQTPSQMDSQARISVEEQIPAITPLNFVKRHSSQSSQVSSITPETISGNPTLTSPDEISDAISVISTPAPSSQPSQQPTHLALGDNSKPSPHSMSEGVSAPTGVVASGRPQLLNQQLPSPMQQSNTTTPLQGRVSSATATATTMTQVNMIMSPSNTGITCKPNIQAAPPSIQGSSSQGHHHSISPPSQAAIPGKLSMSPGPLKPQGNASAPFLTQTSATIAPGRPPSQIGGTTHANPAQFGVQNNSTHHMNNAVQQVQANIPTSHGNGPTQIPATTFVQQAPHHPLGQNNARPHSILGSLTFEHTQSAIQKPQFQHPVMIRPPSQQSAVQPPIAHQSVGPNTPHISSQSPYQHSSPMTQSVSPIQSQVSSPAQSITSLHVSQTSTPASTFVTMNNHTSSNINSNQTNITPIRPSSVPAHAPSQQVENVAPSVGFHSKPSSPAGIVQGQQSSQTPNPPAIKPFPMLPGQVTPLPSQIGSALFPPPVQQSTFNNHAKPMTNTPQQPMQTTSGGAIQHHVIPGHVNPISNPPQGNVVYGQAPSQAQMKPPQQQAPSSHAGAGHIGGYQPSTSQLQPQHTASSSPTVTDQPNNSYTTLSPPAGVLPTNVQYAFSPPPVAQAQQLPQTPIVASPITAAQGKPFTSTQAAAALTDAGKGMKKWAKKVWKNPAIKQTAVGIGGAVMAESMGVDGVAGAQIANNLFANATRPPLAHAQTAPAQAHGMPSAVPQHQPVQMGQQHHPGKPQPLPSQPNHHPGYPQPGHLHPSQLQSSHPQSGHPQLVHQQPSHPQPAYHQPANSQPVHQPAGAQMPGRPPVAQNPSIAVGAAINFNAQAQAQIGFNQQQQYPIRPAMINIPPPPPPPVIHVGVPGTQAQAQVNIDAANLATAAVIAGSAVGAAFHHDHPQHGHGHAQSDHMSHPGPHSSENQGYGVEHHYETHEQAYGYADNSHVAADTTYIDNSTHSLNNTYIDNTEVVNNTIYIENSTAVAADVAYSNTGYVDTATYGETEVTTNIAVDVDVSSAVYTDSSATAFGMDESINIASSSEFAVSSTDYSGDGYGDFEF